MLGACSAPSPGTAVPIGSTGATLSCPPLERPGDGYAPWETWRRRDECVSRRGIRWSVRRDPSDPDGWRHFLRREGGGDKSWELVVTSPTGLAIRDDGSLVLLDLKDRITLISPAGQILARSSHPDCGAVEQLAVAPDGSLAFTCGYSLLRVDRDGTFRWQKWPFGDTHIHGPWVDADGTLYVTGGGHVAALAPDGTPRWTIETGWNRYVGDLAWLDGGNAVFVTSQAESHTPTSPEGVRVYYEHEPPELFEITRRGEIVRRVPWDGGDPPGGWPPVLAATVDGANRLR